jgi:cell division septum initiation protein DivIVA
MTQEQQSPAGQKAQRRQGVPARPKLGERGEISPLLATTSQQVESILKTTNEAAEQIREDARNEARQFLAQARQRAERLTTERMDRIARVTEDLLQQASAVQEQAAALRVALEQATAELSSDLGAGRPGAAEGQAAREEKTEQEGRRGVFGRRKRRNLPSRQQGEISEGVRVLALQQLTAGADRETIEARLRADFGIEDPSAILESIEAEAPRH